MRSGRQAVILEIISSMEIETQEELCAELTKRNYNVTQATVSRDIKELRLFKVAGVEKKYRYAYIDDGNNKISPKMHNLFRECVLTMRPAMNQVVIKTLRGNGSNAGMIVDKVNLPEIVGTLAGDDTLLIVTESVEAAKIVVEKLSEFLK
ncbi:MAG TPA: arginine repressor [Candidatus Borkfalkia faecipullorum]|uniref:Arginine repressor n=1 Tax=Candidatus Borkfalkia faecipullorum TaxID=2838510 RepID=A0A9D1V9C3_9FIRM|nr:arginine repressor [Candidatus Borkfalkia faecipullorum]